MGRLGLRGVAGRTRFRLAFTPSGECPHLVASMRNSTSLLGVTEGFYGAALGLADWGDALVRFGDAIGADHVILNALTPSPFLATARVDESELLRYYSRQAEVEDDGPRIEGVRGGEVVLGSALMPDTDYVRTAHYNELIRPLGGRHSVFARATAPAAGSSLYVCRGEARGAFEASDAGIVAALMPHLSLAIALASRRSVPGREPDGEQALLEAFHGAALICDGEARVLAANASARSLLDAADGISLGTTRLAAMTAADTERLRRAIACAACGTEWWDPPAVRMRLRRRSGRPALSLRLAPLGRFGHDAGNPRSVGIFISQPDAAIRVDRAALSDAFGLARREGEVVVLLAEGLTLSGIAAALGLSVGTVRQYLKRAFDKTGRHSQAAIVALAREFATPEE